MVRSSLHGHARGTVPCACIRACAGILHACLARPSDAGFGTTFAQFYNDPVPYRLPLGARDNDTTPSWEPATAYTVSPAVPLLPLARVKAAFDTRRGAVYLWGGVRLLWRDPYYNIVGVFNCGGVMAGPCVSGSGWLALDRRSAAPVPMTFSDGVTVYTLSFAQAAVTPAPLRLSAAATAAVYGCALLAQAVAVVGGIASLASASGPHRRPAPAWLADAAAARPQSPPVVWLLACGMGAVSAAALAAVGVGRDAVSVGVLLAALAVGSLAAGARWQGGACCGAAPSVAAGTATGLRLPVPATVAGPLSALVAAGRGAQPAITAAATPRLAPSGVGSGSEEEALGSAACVRSTPAVFTVGMAALVASFALTLVLLASPVASQSGLGLATVALGATAQACAVLHGLFFWRLLTRGRLSKAHEAGRLPLLHGASEQEGDDEGVSTLPPTLWWSGANQPPPEERTWAARRLRQEQQRAAAGRALHRGPGVPAPQLAGGVIAIPTGSWGSVPVTENRVPELPGDPLHGSLGDSASGGGSEGNHVPSIASSMVASDATPTPMAAGPPMRLAPAWHGPATGATSPSALTAGVSLPVATYSEGSWDPAQGAAFVPARQLARASPLPAEQVSAARGAATADSAAERAASLSAAPQSQAALREDLSRDGVLLFATSSAGASAAGGMVARPVGGRGGGGWADWRPAWM
jgi:hypothetical protein